MRIQNINHIQKAYGMGETMTYQKVKLKEKDKVIVSKEAKAYQKAYTAAKSSPDVRSEKVGQIKEAIASGQYSVGAKEISEKIVSQLDLRG